MAADWSVAGIAGPGRSEDAGHGESHGHHRAACLLYTSDAADERSSVDLGGRRIIKKQRPVYSVERACNAHHQGDDESAVTHTTRTLTQKETR